MLCENCGYQNDLNAVFCKNCGANLRQIKEDKIECSHCGSLNPNYAVFCSECGFDVKSDKPVNIKTTKKSVSREFDLNIEEILEDWEIYHALREIIANALDEQVLTNSKDIKILRILTADTIYLTMEGDLNMII